MTSKKVKVQELIQSIEKVLPASDAKSIVSQTDHLIFNDGFVSTYNGKISISTPVDVNLDVSVPAKDFHKILKSIDSETCSIDSESGVLYVTSDDLRSTISTDIEEDAALTCIKKFDLDDLYDGKETLLPENFIESLELCIHSASKNADDANNLNCICVDNGTMTSGDGYRATKCDLENEMDRVLIPLSSAVELVKFYPIEFLISDGWIHLLDEFDTTFSLRIVVGDFPDVEGIIESFKSEANVVFPDSLKDVVSTLGNMAESPIELFRTVELTMSGKTIECSVDKTGVSVTKTIELDEEVSDISLMISAPMLSSILQRTNKMEVNENFAMFQTDTFTHVITLVL